MVTLRVCKVLLPRFQIASKAKVSMPRLTKKLIGCAVAAPKEYFLWDSELKGFGARVSPKGRKSFIVQYRQHGRTRRMGIGTYGSLTPDEARNQAKKVLGEVAQGHDPSAARQVERKALTVGALCDRFMDDHVMHHCKPTTQREYRRACDLFIKPHMGSTRVHRVDRAQIYDLHLKLKNKPYQANRVLGVISKMFNLAEAWGLRPDNSNPTRAIQKYKENKRERFLNPNEIHRLWSRLDEAAGNGSESPYVCAAFKLLLLTGCRLSEIQFMRWDALKGNTFQLKDAKTGPRTILLSPAALTVLDSLMEIPGNPYVIAGQIEGQAATDLQRPWRRVRKVAGIDDVRIHDLRHTYASIAASAGHSLPMIGKLLGHTQAQTTQRYAHLAEDTARKASNEIDGLIQEFVRDTANA